MICVNFPFALPVFSPSDVMLLVIVSLVMQYYVITYYHVIMGMNNDECHVLETAVNISKRSVRIWHAIVPAGHYMHNCDVESLQVNTEYVPEITRLIACCAVNKGQWVVVKTEPRTE